MRCLYPDYFILQTKNRDFLEKVLINLINKNDPHILNILKDLMPLSKYGPKFETRYYHPGDYEKCYDPECGNLPSIFQITLNHFFSLKYILLFLFIVRLSLIYFVISFLKIAKSIIEMSFASRTKEFCINSIIHIYACSHV